MGTSGSCVLDCCDGMADDKRIGAVTAAGGRWSAANESRTHYGTQLAELLSVVVVTNMLREP
jgi:hypothetical protein